MLLWRSYFPLQKKLMFKIRRMSIQRRSICGTWRYSQDWQTKKKQPTNNWDVACCILVNYRRYSSLSTPIGSAFCCSYGWSSFLKTNRTLIEIGQNYHLCTLEGLFDQAPSRSHPSKMELLTMPLGNFWSTCLKIPCWRATTKTP